MQRIVKFLDFDGGILFAIWINKSIQLFSIFRKIFKILTTIKFLAYMYFISFVFSSEEASDLLQSMNRGLEPVQ